MRFESIPTVLVRFVKSRKDGPKKGREVRINEVDFDQELHEKLEEPEPKGVEVEAVVVIEDPTAPGKSLTIRASEFASERHKRFVAGETKKTGGSGRKQIAE